MIDWIAWLYFSQLLLVGTTLQALTILVDLWTIFSVYKTVLVRNPLVKIWNSRKNFIFKINFTSHWMNQFKGLVKSLRKLEAISSPKVVAFWMEKKWYVWICFTRLWWKMNVWFIHLDYQIIGILKLWWPRSVIIQVFKRSWQSQRERFFIWLFSIS